MKCMTSKIITPFVLICLLSCLLFLFLVLPLYNDPGFSTFSYLWHGSTDTVLCIYYYCSVQSLSHVQLLAAPWITARQAYLSITNSWSLLKPMSVGSVMPSNHLILCIPNSSCPKSLPASGSFPMSQLFTWGGQSIAVSATASLLPMNTQDLSPLGWTA